MECDKTLSDYIDIEIEHPYPVSGAPVKFRVRGLTSKETAEVMVEYGVDDKRTFATMRASDHKAVFLGLGGEKKLGSEGWDKADPITLDNVESLTEPALQELSRAVLKLTYPTAEQIKN